MINLALKPVHLGNAGSIVHDRLSCILRKCVTVSF